MKCLLVHNFYQQRGGEDAVFTAESAMLEQAGHAVARFTLHNDALGAKTKFAQLGATFWNRDAGQQLEQLVDAFRPDVVHFHNIFPLMSPSVLHAVRHSKAATVMTLHNYRLLCPSANLYRDRSVCTDCVSRTIKWPAALHRCYRTSAAASAAVAALTVVERLSGCLDLIDRFIVPSNSARDVFADAGFPVDRVVVKSNFVPSPPPRPLRVPRERFVLYVGRITPEKGIPTLIEAWRRPDAPDIPLLLVGDGPLARTLAGDDERIRWLGSQDPVAVRRLMRRASLLVFPSEWLEPFGLTIVEAFANGLPVLAARIGAAAELVEDRETGRLFEPGNAAALARTARYMLEDPSALFMMGEHALRTYRANFTPERNLGLLLNVYEAAIAARAER